MPITRLKFNVIRVVQLCALFLNAASEVKFHVHLGTSKRKIRPTLKACWGQKKGFEVCSTTHDLAKAKKEIFLLTVAKLEERRVGRSVQIFFWTLKFWPKVVTSQDPPVVKQQCGTAFQSLSWSRRWSLVRKSWIYMYLIWLNGSQKAITTLRVNFSKLGVLYGVQVTLNFNAMWQKPIFCVFEVAKFDFNRHHVNVWKSNFLKHSIALQIHPYVQKKRKYLEKCILTHIQVLLISKKCTGFDRCGENFFVCLFFIPSSNTSEYFSDGSCWEIIIIKQIHTFTSNILF